MRTFSQKIIDPSLTIYFFQFFVDFFRLFCCSNNIYFNKLTDNRLFNVLSAGFNASIQSSWKVVNNAAKVLYFILARPVCSKSVFLKQKSHFILAVLIAFL
jgi:hypothetical protein